MGRPKGSTKWPPKYCRQGKRWARVTLPGGKTIPLGKYDSPESWEKYHRVCAEAKVKGVVGYVTDKKTITVSELCAAFWLWADNRYTKQASKAGYLWTIRRLRKAYGSLPAMEFTPLKLRALRDEMIDDPYWGKGWAKWKRTRKGINRTVNQIRFIFSWGAERELIDGSTNYALLAVKPLEPGESSARETDEVQPVADDVVDATIPYMTPHVAAMVKIQRHTGMRSDEVCTLRAININMGGDVWLYKPDHHKTEHHGKKRIVQIGATAQEIIRPFLKGDASAYLFVPSESYKLYHRSRRKAKRYADDKMDERNASLKSARYKAGIKPKPWRERYNFRTYRKSIACAINAANKAGAQIPYWRPHQLRHSFASACDAADHDIRAISQQLGHSSEAMTRRYIKEKDKAGPMIRKLG